MQQIRNQRQPCPREGIEFPSKSGVKASAHDGFQLIDLHCRLLHSDYQRFRSAVGVAVATLLAAAAVAMASVSAVLGGVAYLLAQFSPLDLAGSLLVCGASLLVLAILAAWWASRWIARSFAAFDASLQEGRRTLCWLQSHFEQ